VTHPTRGHRRRSSATRGRLAHHIRPPLALAWIPAIVLSAVAIALVLSGALDRPGRAGTPAIAGASAAPTDLLLVTPAPSGTPEFSLPPVVAPSPSEAATGVPSEGIRAKRIRIERLAIDLPIVEGDGIDAPLGKAAHYPGTAWPGGGSNIYIYGHARKGMFLSLWEAKVGDEVIFLLVDGTERTYVVTEVLPRVPWNAVHYIEPTPTEQLTLQTSTSYGPTAPRFIVIALPKT
jgi:LPXTG-site transpeptidase (sortase) family protein